jgi:hypothetical protein
MSATRPVKSSGTLEILSLPAWFALMSAVR